MDRREALQKIAAGGATIAGAALITSSRAFADGGTVNFQPTGTAGFVSLNGLQAFPTGNKATRRVSAARLSTQLGSCPSGDTPKKQYAWSTSSGTITGSAFSTNLVDATATAPGGGNWNGTFTVTLTVRWICPGASGPAWVCRGFRVTVSASTGGGSSGSTSNGPTTEVAPVNCDTPPITYP